MPTGTPNTVATGVTNDAPDCFGIIGFYTAGHSLDKFAGPWEFYHLRNRIVRGDEIGETDLRNARGEEHIRIAPSLFEESIWGILIELGKLREEERAPHFFSRSHWHTQLGLPNDLWYP
jgi:hypothetical protein